MTIDGIMNEEQFQKVRGRVETIIVGLPIIQTVIVMLSIASSSCAMILKMNREDWLEMCGEMYDRRTAELATRKIVQ